MRTFEVCYDGEKHEVICKNEEYFTQLICFLASAEMSKQGFTLKILNK